MGVFVVEGLRLNGGNVATKQYSDANLRLNLGPKSNGPPTANGKTPGETHWNDSGVSVWTGSLWRMIPFGIPLDPAQHTQPAVVETNYTTMDPQEEPNMRNGTAISLGNWYYGTSVATYYRDALDTQRLFDNKTQRSIIWSNFDAIGGLPPHNGEDWAGFRRGLKLVGESTRLHARINCDMQTPGALDGFTFALGIQGAHTLFGISAFVSNNAAVMNDSQATIGNAGTIQWPSLNAPREANLRSVSVANATRVWDIQNLVDLNDSPQIPWRQGRLFYTVSASSPLEWTYQDIAHQPITGDLYNELLSRTQQYQQRFPLATVVPTETHRYVVFVVYVQDTLLGNPGSPNTEYPLEIMELNPMWRQQPGP